VTSSLWSRFLLSSSSFLGSTAQLRPWPPPQNPAEFLGGFSKIFFFYRVGSLAPRPTPILEDQASVFIYPRGRVATHFSRLLRHAWVTVGLFLFPGHHTGKIPPLEANNQADSKEIPAFYGSRRFITLFVSVRHLSVS
jgi:hypothetical protein